MSQSSGNVLKNFIGPGWHTSGSALFPEKHPGGGRGGEVDLLESAGHPEVRQIVVPGTK
jgi:hypothetical protein